MRENSRLSSCLSAAVEGSAMANDAARARCATDASIYQTFPDAVLVPRSVNDIGAIRDITREEAVPVLPRGGSTPRACRSRSSIIRRPS